MFCFVHFLLFRDRTNPAEGISIGEVMGTFLHSFMRFFEVNPFIEGKLSDSPFNCGGRRPSLTGSIRGRKMNGDNPIELAPMAWLAAEHPIRSASDGANLPRRSLPLPKWQLLQGARLATRRRFEPCHP